jgi:hypothetical protein
MENKWNNVDTFVEFNGIMWIRAEFVIFLAVPRSILALSTSTKNWPAPDSHRVWLAYTVVLKPCWCWSHPEMAI